MQLFTVEAMLFCLPRPRLAQQPPCLRQLRQATPDASPLSDQLLLWVQMTCCACVQGPLGEFVRLIKDACNETGRILGDTGGCPYVANTLVTLGHAAPAAPPTCRGGLAWHMVCFTHWHL